MQVEGQPITHRHNAVFWVMLGIPAFAVVASMLLIIESVRSKDPELPAEYAIEGRALETDFDAAERAHSAGITLTVDYVGSNRLRVRAAANDANTLPRSLELRFTHMTQAARDRRVVLQREAMNVYVADFAPLERGRWLLQVDAKPDASAPWILRKRLHAPFDVVNIGR
jgi:hypothetical protein